jgi:hypothetical protein
MKGSAVSRKVDGEQQNADAFAGVVGQRAGDQRQLNKSQ